MIVNFSVHCCKITNKCVKELVGFINVFQIFRSMFRQVVAIFRGVVGALEATQVIAILWAYTDYDPSSVASCRGTYPGVYSGFSFCGDCSSVFNV
jgi:hypothetical protein